MVHLDEKDTVLITDIHQKSREQRPGENIHRLICFISDKIYGLFFPLLVLAIPDRNDRKPGRLGLFYHLFPVSVFVYKDGSQGLMPPHYLIEGFLNKLLFENSSYPDSVTDVVTRRARVQLL